MFRTSGRLAVRMAEIPTLPRTNEATEFALREPAGCTSSATHTAGRHRQTPPSATRLMIAPVQGRLVPSPRPIPARPRAEPLVLGNRRELATAPSADTDTRTPPAHQTNAQTDTPADKTADDCSAEQIGGHTAHKPSFPPPSAHRGEISKVRGVRRPTLKKRGFIARPRVLLGFGRGRRTSRDLVRPVSGPSRPSL